jgi:microbial collagenase
MRGVLSDSHVIAVLNAIATASPAYQGDDQQHFLELMDFAHAAYYLKSYNPGDPQLFTLAAVQPAALQAFNAFTANPHFDDFTQTAASVLYDWVNAVDAADLGDEYYSALVSILHVFNTDQQRWADWYQGSAVFTTLVAVHRQLEVNPAFPAAVDQSLVNELSALATNVGLPQVTAYLPANAIWALGGICQHVPGWKAAAVQAITNARAAWPQLSAPWLWTVSALDDCNGCFDANNVKLCKSDVIPLLEAADLPNTFTLDDGAITVRTPLTLPQVQPLYHAVKAVEAQFNRLTQTIAPLAGDPNGTLKVVLFGSRAAYEKDAPFMFGLSTANGGIYIEQDGTFYTYDRTPQESIYTLEELFRHEFTHYLAGRFLVAGMWGQAPIYQGGRMIWFDEGLAEFCTWSTTNDGIKPRHRLVELVQQDGNNRMSVQQTLSAVYGDFKFYRYAALLFAYWYENDLGTLLSLIELVRAGDVAGYDGAVAQLKADANLQTAYDLYLDGLVAGLGGLDDPSTTVPPLNALDLATPADVEPHLRQTRVGYRADCTVAAVEANTRFSARGTLSGPLGNQQNTVAAWTEFDGQLDEMVGELEQQGINNFDAVDARFGRIRWVDFGGQSYPMADYFVEGPLVHGAAALQPPLQQVTADFQSTRLGGNANAALLGPKTVQVKLSLTTGVYPVATAASVLDAALADEREELRNQVFAIRPPYYRDFTVDWDGGPQTIPIGNQQKYGLRNVVCIVNIP